MFSTLLLITQYNESFLYQALERMLFVRSNFQLNSSKALKFYNFYTNVFVNIRTISQIERYKTIFYKHKKSYCSLFFPTLNLHLVAVYGKSQYAKEVAVPIKEAIFRKKNNNLVNF